MPQCDHFDDPTTCKFCAPRDVVIARFEAEIRRLRNLTVQDGDGRIVTQGAFNALLYQRDTAWEKQREAEFMRDRYKAALEVYRGTSLPFYGPAADIALDAPLPGDQRSTEWCSFCGERTDHNEDNCPSGRYEGQEVANRLDSE